MTAQARFSRIRQPFRCIQCGKNTTGPSGVIGPQLCRPCFDAAGLENEHFDGYHQDKPSAACPLCLKGVAQ